MQNATVTSKPMIYTFPGRSPVRLNRPIDNPPTRSKAQVEKISQVSLYPAIYASRSAAPTTTTITGASMPP